MDPYIANEYDDAGLQNVNERFLQTLSHTCFKNSRPYSLETNRANATIQEYIN